MIVLQMLPQITQDVADRSGSRTNYHDKNQLEPLAKALLLPKVNLFIADDVGLDKTNEAGLIAYELLLRRRIRNIVVSCPPAMLGRWKDELETRFGNDRTLQPAPAVFYHYFLII